MEDYIFNTEWFEDDDDQFLETDAYNEALASIGQASDGWGFIAHGSIQHWNGVSGGYLIADDANDLVKQINHEMGCTVDSIYLTGDELRIDASHHDGGMTLSVRALTQEGSYFLNDSHDADEPIDIDVLKSTFESNKYSENLPKLRDLYGLDSKTQQASDISLASFQIGKWRVHLVDLGDKWGLDDRLTCERKDLGKRGLPLVEFYDMSQDSKKFPEGQFVSRYYMETLLGLDGEPKDSLVNIAKDGGSLGLYGSCPSWKLTNEETILVGRALNELAETKYEDRLIMDQPSRSTSLREACEQAKQASVALNDHSSNQPIKSQEAR